MWLLSCPFKSSEVEYLLPHWGSWIVDLQCRFFHVSSVDLIGCICCQGAAEWFFNSVGYFKFLQAIWCWGFITLEAAEWFTTVVSSFIFRNALCWKFVATVWAVEMFLISVGNFMFPQDVFFWASVGTI